MESKLVTYNNKQYRVYKIKYKDVYKLFVIDEEDSDKLNKYKNWHYNKCGYIGRDYYKNKKRKRLYLHNLIMNRLEHNGKGQTESIDHINRIELDNRNENLRLLSQSQQNYNQKRKPRKSVLPENCGFTWDDVSKCVYYRKYSGNRGNRFYVEIRNIDGIKRLRWYSTGSKSVSLKFKLEHAKKYLRYLNKQYSDEFEQRGISTNYTEERLNLIKTFNSILKLSRFACVESNLIELQTIKYYLEKDINGLTEEEIKMLENVKIGTTKNRCKTTQIPNSIITVDMIPKYCYYKKQNKHRGEGDGFVIDKRHPDMNGKSWTTSTSKSVDTVEKFIQLYGKIIEIGN